MALTVDGERAARARSTAPCRRRRWRDAPSRSPTPARRRPAQVVRHRVGQSASRRSRRRRRATPSSAAYYTLDGTKVDPRAACARTTALVVVLKVTEPEARLRARCCWSTCCRPGSRSTTRSLVDGSDVAGLSWLKRDVEPAAHRVSRRPLRRRLRPRAGKADLLHARLCGARRLARPLRASAGDGRGHVPARALRPHRLRHGRGAAGTVRRRSSSRAKRSGDPGPFRDEPVLRALGTTRRGARRREAIAMMTLRSRVSTIASARAWLAALAGVVLALGAALALYVQALGPLDLTAAEGRSTVVLDRDGRLLRAFTTTERPLASAGRRPPTSIRAFSPCCIGLRGPAVSPAITASIRWRSAARALGRWLRHGRIVSGGSTLTMQVARLLEPRERAHAVRQAAPDGARGAARAALFARPRSSTSICALAPYGGNLEGVRAASLTYFGKEPKRLTLAEAALLVALPQSPETRRPDRVAAGGPRRPRPRARPRRWRAA